MIPRKLKELLDRNDVKYEILRHSISHTSQHSAAETHISGSHFAKTVLLKSNGKILMTILPADS